MISEKVLGPIPGLVMLFAYFVLLGLVGWFFLGAIRTQDSIRILVSVTAFVLLMLLPAGFVMVQPNDSRVLTLFGRYFGSIKEAGFWWVNPFTLKKRISLKTRNFETAKLKVNDANRDRKSTRLNSS